MKHTLKRSTGWVVLLAMILSLLAPIAPAQAADTPSTITIIHTNDVHGYAVEEEEAEKLGYAKLKTFIDEKKAQNTNTLILDAGDVLHGTTFATISSGDSMMDLMTQMGYDALTPGNHDFNYGYARLKDLADTYALPVLAANISLAADGAPAFDSAIIKDVNGVKVGIFGLATPETKTKSSPLNTEGLTFEDPYESAEKAVADLQEEGADVIIALSHLGLDKASEETDDQVAEKVAGIDVIIGGHSHTVLEEGTMVGETLIAQTGNHLQSIGEVTLTMDGKEIASKSAQLHPYAELAGLTPNPTIEAEVAAVEEANKPYLEQVLGAAAVDLDGERESNRTGETNLGNLITDVMREISGADVAITNGGGIRASIPAREITMGHVVTTFPFTNYPVVLEVTGDIIKDALEHGVDAYPESAGKFPQVSGMTFKIDVTQPVGSRVLDLEVAGAPLDRNKTYTLVTNDFMSIGGDGYEMFKGQKKVAEYALLSEVLADAIKAMGRVEAEVEGRITEGKATPVTGPIQVVFNGQTLEFDQEPMIKNDRVMIPFRVFGEATGATVDWNEVDRTVTMNDVKLTIDQAEVLVGGETIALDSPAIIVASRTLVPLRFVSENFAYEVEWDENQRMVTIQGVA